jgi:hypothetical protein
MKFKRCLNHFWKNFEFISNSETLWTKVLEKLIKLLKISLKILKKLIKYTDVLQIKSKPHLTLLPDGRLRGRGFETAFFPEWKCFFLIELGWYDRQKTTLKRSHFCRPPTYFNLSIFFKLFQMICISQLRLQILTFKRGHYQNT